MDMRLLSSPKNEVIISSLTYCLDTVIRNFSPQNSDSLADLGDTWDASTFSAHFSFAYSFGKDWPNNILEQPCNSCPSLLRNSGSTKNGYDIKKAKAILL